MDDYTKQMFDRIDEIEKRATVLASARLKPIRHYGGTYFIKPKGFTSDGIHIIPVTWIIDEIAEFEKGLWYCIKGSDNRIRFKLKAMAKEEGLIKG